MTEEEILYKAILKAEKNGYKGHMQYLPLFLHRDPSKKKKFTKKQFKELLSRVWYRNKEAIIFSHDFAKAFFGRKFIWDKNSYRPEIHGFDKKIEFWKYYLQEIILEENPIKYLERFL